MSETLVDYNDRNNVPLSNEKTQQAVSKVMAETEEEERDTKRNASNVTMDTFFNQSTKRNFKCDKREANFFGHSGKSNKRI